MGIAVQDTGIHVQIMESGYESHMEIAVFTMEAY